MGPSPGSNLRALVEIRWYEVSVIIAPDGSARMISEEEWRVVSGQLEHVEFNHPKRPRQFIIWCTAPGRLSRLPASQGPNLLSVDRIDFLSPLTARHAEWVRTCVNVEWPAWYSMAAPDSVKTRQGAAAGRAREFQSIDVLSHGRRFSRRLAANAILRLQVMFPAGYPVGRVRSRVVHQTETEHSDDVEGKRLNDLSRDESSQHGLRRFGRTMTLSVPKPLPDRHYLIEWDLPTAAQRRKWLREVRRVHRS